MRSLIDDRSAIMGDSPRAPIASTDGIYIHLPCPFVDFDGCGIAAGSSADTDYAEKEQSNGCSSTDLWE
jgi:hypothetical protein